MSRDPNIDIANQLLADLVRSSLAGTFAKELGSPAKLGRNRPSVLHVGSDLPSYLRTVRRRLITKEVAAMLHWHAETVYRRIRDEGFPAHRDGQRWKYDPTEIADWLDRDSVTASTSITRKEGR